jgi:hypothetical protein
MRMVGRAPTALLASLCFLALLASCHAPEGSDDAGDGDVQALDASMLDAQERDGAPSPDDGDVREPEARCIDEDGDGFGVDCPAGADCDDRNASITDECYRCARPATGCACDTPGVRRACDALTDSDVAGPDGVCRLGERLCTDGRWTRCTALDSHTRTVTPPTTCGTSCNPECRVTTVCPNTRGDIGDGTNVVIGGSGSTPAFCPMGMGGITLPGGPSDGSTDPTCGGTCGGTCCPTGQTCWTRTEDSAYPSWCFGGSRVPPPPAVTSACGRQCRIGETVCGFPPNEGCCSAGQLCRKGVCFTPGGSCSADSGCPAGSYCDMSVGRCFPRPTAACSCEADTAQRGCLNSLIAQGGEVIDGIFRTANGQDARSLRFARYLRGLEGTPGSCPFGRSNGSTDLQFPCSSCNPSTCGSSVCFTGPKDYPTFGRFGDRLDWMWTQHVRTNDSGAAVPTGDSRFYYPWRSRIYDLGAPANRVVLFPIVNRAGDSCLGTVGSTVWLTDNPDATEIASASSPDPNKWNPTTLMRVFTQGWTRNPRAMGDPSDTNDLESTAFGDAMADGMSTVWALPCGLSFRYAAVAAGNNGNPTGSCQYHTATDQIDAVAGLTVEGNGLAIHHVLPYGTGAGPDGLSFTTQVRTADIYFLFDTTGSMGEELTNLKLSLTTGTYAGCTGGLVGGIRCIIPDAWFGVGYHDDFPVSPYGMGIDQVYRNLLDLNSSSTLTQAAVNSLVIHNGNDNPESQVPALYAVATGAGFGSFLSARTGCPAGRFGYPCFRPGTIPIVMLFTDAMFHNGPGDTYMYTDRTVFGTGSTLRTPRFNEAVDALNAIGAKVIIVNSCDNQTWCKPDARNHAVTLANQTRSLVAGGSPAVYDIRANGSGLDTAVINGVRDLANYSRMDVTAIALDNPATPGFDERCFVVSPAGSPLGTIRLSNPAIGESAPYPGGRCIDPPGSASGVPVTARQCLPGTSVNFRAEFFNRCVMSTGVRQTFNFDIVTLGDGTYELGRVPVTIVVPEHIYPESGTFNYDVNSTTVCAPGQQPDWTQLQFAADTPTGTSIRIELQTAATAAGLATAPVVRLGTVPPSASPLELSAALLAAGQSNRLPHLRVRFTLYSTPARDRAPTLTGYRVLFNCIDGT